MTHTTTAPIVLITGATSGIGFETARRLASAGSTVVLHGPTQLSVENTAARLVKDGVMPHNLDLWAADFASLAEVSAMTMHLRAKYRRIDVLINNAAIAAPSERRETDDGNELTFQVNYLAPYLLTRLLSERLKAAPHGRMVAVSSSLHRVATINWADLQCARNYVPMAAYAQSKLALTMFARALAGNEPLIASASLHPGVVETDLLPIYSHIGGPVSEAATAVIHLCSPQLRVVSGAYYDMCREATPGPMVDNRSARDRLWRLSAHLVGLDLAVSGTRV